MLRHAKIKAILDILKLETAKNETKEGGQIIYKLFLQYYK